MSNKKKNRQSKVSSSKSQVVIYPQKQKKKPIDKKAFMKKKKNRVKFSFKLWFTARCKGAINTIVENVIVSIIKLIGLCILFYLFVK